MMKQYLLSVTFFVACCFSAYSQTPSNDICTNALPITVNGGYIAVSNNNTVTNGPNPSCGGSTLIRDVWYYFVYTGGTIVIETQLGTNTDTRLAIFSSCGGTQLACNDDFGGTYRSSISLTCSTLTVGSTYYIQAGGYNATVGNFTMSVSASGILGCTDPMATNYTVCATQNNGSCTYPVLTAQFNYAPTGTNCLNIQYTSTSSGNITGYNWSFPGGTPSTSTAQNPVVTYPSAGTYSASLTVSDATPNSHIATNNNVQVVTGDIVTVDITPDANPSQTSWKMFDNANAVIAQGTSNDATFCINENCHRFEIYDSGSNGLTGTGNYKVYLNGIQVASGAAFSALDMRYVNCPDGTSCDVPLDASLGINEVPFDNSWFVFTPAENGQYRISTCGLAACDTRVWVYDYCIMANFDNSNEATYTYNDDLCGVQAEAGMYMLGGDTYYVRVGSTGSCSGASYEVLFEYTGPIQGCMDINACNYNPLAGVSAPCYYNGDPNCSGLGPDLEVDLGQMYSSLTSTTMNGTDACMVNEGCLQGLGTREILKFTTRIANIGTQDYFIGVPSASNPQFNFDPCHNHYHYAGYAEYLLYNQNGEPMDNIGFKNGFCVLDLSCPSGISAHYSCGNMGITAGCADIYSSSLSCQWIDITGVPAGDYFLVIRTNWDQSPDQLGHYELRYDNNWAQVCIHFERNATTGAIQNFTKTIASCPVIEDCLGTPFGDVYEDCEGNCPGVVIKGDINSDDLFNPFDEHLYAEAAVYGGVTASPCNDLNNDGEITVADAAFAGECVHQQEDAGVPPMQFTSCAWDDEFLDVNENVTLGITNLNTTESYFDVYIVNPQNEVLAFQVDFSGAVVASVENLISGTWSAHIHPEVGGNSLAVMSNAHSKIQTYTNPTPVLRVHYSSLTGSTVCVSNIVDVINDLLHNTLTTYGSCQSAVPPVSADFSGSQTSVCSGQPVSFTDLSTGSPTSWSWSFPGGSPSSSLSQNPVITYNTAGTYTVTLTATGPGGNDTEVKTNYITVGSAVQWFRDIDNDGYGNNAVSTSSCTQPSGYVSQGGDCNDGNLAIHPGALESCNGSDDDCDGSIDEGFDLDGDGYTTCDGDCNDNNALAHPNAFEICNSLDEDCDGSIDEGYDADNDGFTICGGDCNDNNSSVHPGAMETCNDSDEDCDGSIDEGFDIDGDGFTSCNGDCNDSNASVHPGATETCNGVNDDCDGSVDEGFDLDGDGFTTCNGDCNDNNFDINPESSESCNGIDDDCNGSVDEGFDQDGDGYTTCEGDCDDTEAAINPGAPEICNSEDDNCNEIINEGYDTDGDGYSSCNGDCDDGNAAIHPGAIETCNGTDDNCNNQIDENADDDGDGFSYCNGDCDDANAAIHPGAAETCNGHDDDCDGLTDEGFDADSDGYSTCAGDCNDNNASVNPGISETCNGIDDDCDGSVDENLDLDGDGYTNCNGDCNDSNASIHPGAAETCNNTDDNCNGLVDETFDDDGDGYTACNGDCNDGNASIHPGATEICNNSDDDCDGTIDEGFDGDGDGYTACNGDCNNNNPNIHPGASEVCNGADEDCDGAIDEGFDVDGDGYTTCNGDCNDSNAQVFPTHAEACNGVDEDCDGAIDEGFDVDGDGHTTCAGDCNDNNPAIHPSATELCNSIDDNCNGTVDDNAGPTYYIDSDGDGYGNPNVSIHACSPPTGYVTNNLDCYDSFANRNPAAIEMCNSIDDDCDGVVDDNCSSVVNDFRVNAILLPVASYNSCTTSASTLAGATVSSESHSTVITGQDVWFKFVAPDPGIRVRVLTGAADVLIELQDASGNTIDTENIQATKANETLNYSGLTVGGTYYVSVRNYNSAGGTGSFSICLTSLPQSYCNSVEEQFTLCGTFKALSTSATQYTFNFTSLSTGINYTRTQGSVNCVMSTVTNLPLGQYFNVRIDAQYSVSRGNGAMETITVLGAQTCQIYIIPDGDLNMRDGYACPYPRALNSQVKTNIIICAASNYEWEFQLANLSQPAFFVNGGTSFLLTLLPSYGLAAGQTYNVRVRAAHSNGYVGPWGPVRCLLISSSGMATENENEEMIDSEERSDVEVNLYPNPNKGDAFNLYVSEVRGGEVAVQIIDAQGRSIWANRYIVDGYLNTRESFDESLASGLYLVEVYYDGNLVTEKLLVQK